MHKITVTVDAKRRASAPREAFVIADNNDWLVEFDIDAAAGFNTAAEMTAVLVTERGKLPDITFNAGQITLPRLIEADGGLLYIGVTQGDIKTTGWACVRIQQSIYTKAHGRTAPNPDDPQDNDALPAAEDLALTDEIVVNDVAAGRRERATLAQLQALIGGGGSDESIFPVVYGETLHADILEAYEAGKLCVMEYGAETYICTTATAVLAAFANLPTAGALTAKRVEVTAADAWSTREDDLPNAADVVMYTAQIKTPAQKLRARQNIGALGGADAAVTVEMTSESFASGSIVNTSAIFSDIVEEVAKQEKINFILNDILHFVVAHISDDDEESMTLFCAPDSAGTGKWFMLTLEPNIDPDSGMSGNLVAFPAPVDALKYSAQSLTDAQKAQARGNIGAADAPLVVTYTAIMSGSAITSVTCDTAYADILAAATANRPIKININMGGVILGTTAAIAYSGDILYIGLILCDDVGNVNFIWICHTYNFIEMGLETRAALSSQTPIMDSENGSAGISDNPARGDHSHPSDTSRSPVWRYTTLTLATSDWSAVTGGYSCSKTVSGMTSTAIVIVAYSDTETEFTEAQSTDALTFTVADLPSAAITVNVSFVEGVSV